MKTRPHRHLGDRARRPILPFTILTVVAILSAGCGAGTPSPSAAVAASTGPATAASPHPASPAVVAADWPGFHGGASRSGVGNAGPIGHPVLNWQFRAKAAVPNNLAIVGDLVSFASDDGTVYGLDRVSGAQTWTVTLDAAPLVGPVADGGRLFFTTGAGGVIALDSADGHTLWTTTATYDGPSQLASDSGILYFGTNDGFLVALDAASGAERWKLQPTPGTGVLRSPAVANGLVYVGTKGMLVAVDTTSHQVVWTGDVGGEVTGTASVAGGLAYVGARVDETSGTLHAFDATTGAPRWTADRPLLQVPTVADGVAYSASQNGLVVAIDLASGATRWGIQLTGKIRPMAVAGGVLYLGADNEHRVYAIDTATGGKLWHYDVDDSNDCCIAVTAGAVYVGTLAGSVYSIGGDGATIAAEPLASATPSQAPATPAPLVDVAVKVTWTSDLRRMGFAPISQIAVDPTTGRIWAPEAEAGRIAIFDGAGKLLEEWGEPGDGPGQFDFSRANGDGYGTLAFAKDGSFYVLDAGNQRIQQFDARRRFVGQWGGFGTGPGQFSDPVGIAVAADGTVWVLDDRRNVVEHYDRTGKVLGSFDPFAPTPVNDGANSLAIDTTGNLYVSGAAPSKVSVFDPAGRFLRDVGAGVFADQATNMAIDAAGRLFVTQGEARGSAAGILLFGPDGAALGGFGPLGSGDGELRFPAGITTDGRGGIYVEDSVPESARLIRFELPAGLR